MAILGTTPRGWCTEGAPQWCTKAEAAITAGIVTGGTITDGIMIGEIMTGGVNTANTGVVSRPA